MKQNKKIVCRNCGKYPDDPDQEICEHCGSSLKRSVEKKINISTSIKKKTAVIIIMIILLGSIIIGSVSFLKSVETPSGDYFTSVWDTTRISSGSSNNKQIRLPLESTGSYSFTVYWGDGKKNTITHGNQPEILHTYTNQGIYTIKISGKIIGWKFGFAGDKLKLLEISRWKDLRLGNSGGYFAGCLNLKITATDILNLTGTTTMYQAFCACYSIDTVEHMNEWDVSHVTDMFQMFDWAINFNESISDWDVSRVNNMRYMFRATSKYNQNMSKWDVSNVTDMDNMFYNATAFNQDISSWNVSKITKMVSMFQNASAFNQDISNWDVSHVTDMGRMFYYASAFNQNLSNWNVSRVTCMNEIFSHALAFNQNISNWNVSQVTGMDNMFYGVTLSTPNYDSLLIGWSKLMLKNGNDFHAGGSKYSIGDATTARNYITSHFSWTIIDGGQIS